MDFINKILAYINSSGSPELYYIGVAVAVIFVFFIVEKIFKMMFLLAIIGFIAFGFSLLQGKDVNSSIASLKASFNKIVSSTTSGTNGTSSTNNSSSSNSTSSNTSSTNQDSNGSYITGNKKSTNPSQAVSGAASSTQDAISSFLSTLTGGK